MRSRSRFDRDGKSYAATVRDRRRERRNPEAHRTRAPGAPRSRTRSASFWSSCWTVDAPTIAATRPPRRLRAVAFPPGETTADLGVGGGVAEGLVGGWSPTVGLGGTLAYRRWAARLGGVWLPSKSSDFGPGRVEVGLAIARLALCVSTRDDRSRVALGFCVQQQVGWMRGRGVDYDDGNGEADHLWLATGASIVAGGPLGRSLGWEVDVGAVRPLREQRFVVDNLGTAYRSEPAAFMTTFALTTRIW